MGFCNFFTLTPSPSSYCELDRAYQPTENTMQRLKLWLEYVGIVVVVFVALIALLLILMDKENHDRRND